MMKATDLRDRNDAPISLGLRLASMGTVVVEGLMRAGGVVVRQVRGHEPEKAWRLCASFVSTRSQVTRLKVGANARCDRQLSFRLTV